MTGRDIADSQRVGSQRSGGLGPDGSGPRAIRNGDPSRHTRGMKLFDDRVDAGRQLAERLDSFGGQDVVVLGLPRGGVPVAFEVAQALQAPLDVLVVRKLGVPFQPELAFGAIGEDGVRVLNDSVVREAHLDGDEMDTVERKQRIELRRRAERFRRGRDRISLTGRIAVIVDDGIATGATAKAACQVARAHGASRVVLAVPIGPDDIVARFAGYADEVVCLETPAFFFAVGQGYRNFTPTSDDEVDRAARPRPGRLCGGCRDRRRRRPAAARRGSPGGRRAGVGGRAPDHPREPEGRRGLRSRQRKQPAQPRAIGTSQRS